MKLKIIGDAKINDENLIVPVLIGSKNNTRTVEIEIKLKSFDFENWENLFESTIPIEIPDLTSDKTIYWLYRKKIITMYSDFHSYSDEERRLLVVNIVIKREEKFKNIKKQINLYEKFSKSNVYPREQLPEGVKMYVWQRDEGKCVKCSSKEKLEFDHIIPVSKGGANTERNIQLLCEPCNRNKGSKI